MTRLTTDERSNPSDERTRWVIPVTAAGLVVVERAIAEITSGSTRETGPTAELRSCALCCIASEVGGVPMESDSHNWVSSGRPESHRFALRADSEHREMIETALQCAGELIHARTCGEALEFMCWTYLRCRDGND